MQICFIDQSPLDYQSTSPALIPLGGSQSALCYLAQALYTHGHQISLVNHISQARLIQGIQHLPWAKTSEKFLRSQDVLISLNHFPPLLKKPHPPLLFWNQHNIHDPIAEQFANHRIYPSIAAFCFVSQQQRQAYLGHYALPPEKTHVFPNAMAPCFENRFANLDELSQKKAFPLTLVYTSTPGRGLEILLAIFPALKRLCPEIQLKVFSSLAVYQATTEAEAKYQTLYTLCQTTKGVHYFGSVSQPELAAHLEQAHILAYPNTFEESSCIAAIEALASGCRVVTTAFGALPETTGGFARLIQPNRTLKFATDFFGALVAEIASFQNNLQIYTQLWQQVRWSQEHYSWAKRALEWENLLLQLTQ